MAVSTGRDGIDMTNQRGSNDASPPSSTTVTGPVTVKLRRACLSYSEVLAQSVSVIAPSTIPAAVLGLIYAKAGNASWLSFVFGILGIALVSLNINQFARRSASPGSLYSYVVQGMGPTAGVLGGWALLFGYTLTGMSTLCGFALIANVLLHQLLGVHLSVVGLFAAAVLGTFYIAFRDIRLSARTMLIFEGLSLLLVLILGAKIWATAGFAIDRTQLTLQGATPSGALGGVVLVVFAFSGFESATALGDEAKDPLRTIPRSVIQSVVLSGLFFIVMTYLVVAGFAGRTSLSLGSSEAPLNALATAIGWGGLGVAINVGILLSFFSCTLASINSSARILFSMGRHGLVPDALGSAHVENRTPHVAVAVATLITFGVPAALFSSGVSAFDCQGIFGTLCSFGFIVVYILISVAAPVYLWSTGTLTKKAVAYAVGGVSFMLLPLIGTVGFPGSTLFPPADRSGLRLLAIFAGYMATGLGWLYIQRVRRPKMLGRMQSAIASVELEFTMLQERDRALSSGQSPRP